MKHLLHCIFREGPTMECGLPVISGGGLAVATSVWCDEQPAPGVARLRAYANTIAKLHTTRTVIPLRFGCVVDGRLRILGLLERHGREFSGLLDRLEGLAEMGLRIWAEGSPAGEARAGPGSRYLSAARWRHPGPTLAEERRADHLCGALDGLYVDRKTEARPVGEGRLVSLHFLVPKGSVEDFRGRLRQFAGKAPYLATGPWPPYHFVDYVWQ